MDSGNSGSLQSSSGADDEFDSRGCGGGGGDSSTLSALLRTAPAPAPGPGPSTSAFALPGSFYGLQELATAPPSQVVHWSATLPGGAGASSASSPRAVPEAGGGTSAPLADQPAAAPPSRGSRKRTRASRRAPTTVLTTDTTNFRAMVQEFTGIPSPPFAATAAPASFRSRFEHLFPSPSSLRTAAAADPGSLPSYLLRPYAQKLQSSPFPPFASPSSSSPSSSNIGITNDNNTTTSTTAAATSASTNPATAAAAGANYELLPSALLRMQDRNNYLSFQNILSSQFASAAAAKYTSQPMFDPAGGFASTARLQEPLEFLGGLTHGHAHGADELSGLVGSASGSGSCKMNYSSAAGTAAAAASAAELSVDKQPDGAAGPVARATRGDGVDAWICTSE